MHVPEHAGQERDAGGRFRKGAGTIQSLGGKAKSTTTKLARQLDVNVADPALRPHLARARNWAHATCRFLARDVGGGRVPPDAGLLIQQASLEAAASRRAFERGDYALASRLGTALRGHLLAARHLTATAAKSLPAGGGMVDLHRYDAEVEEQLAELNRGLAREGDGGGQ